MDKQQARRNRFMGDWIRAGISSRTMPLEPPDEPDAVDAPDAAAGPSSSGTPAGIDAGAGTGGRRGAPRESFNDFIRQSFREGKQS